MFENGKLYESRTGLTLADLASVLYDLEDMLNVMRVRKLQRIS